MAEGEIGAIVQARTGSIRLPGKVLRHLAGRPALEYLLERLMHAATLSRVIVATSDASDDDAVAEFCRTRGVAVFRGPHEDVAARLLATADSFALSGFVRVNGDSPLLDQALVDRGVSVFRGGGHDLVTNVFPRSFPRGQSVEVLRADALRTARPLMVEPGDREHVTAAIYRHPGRFRIENFSAGPGGVGPDGGPVRLVLDTPEDAIRIEAILQAMNRPHWQYGWPEMLQLARAQAALR